MGCGDGTFIPSCRGVGGFPKQLVLENGRNWTLHAKESENATPGGVLVAATAPLELSVSACLGRPPGVIAWEYCWIRSIIIFVESPLKIVFNAILN